MLINDVKILKTESRAVGEVCTATTGLVDEVKQMATVVGRVHADNDMLHATAECIRNDVKATKKEILAMKGELKTTKTDAHLMKAQLGSMSIDFLDVKSDVCKCTADLSLVQSDIQLIKNDIQEIDSDMKSIRKDMKKIKLEVAQSFTIVSGFSNYLTQVASEIKSDVRCMSETVSQHVMGPFADIKPDEDSQLDESQSQSQTSTSKAGQKPAQVEAVPPAEVVHMSVAEAADILVNNVHPNLPVETAHNGDDEETDEADECEVNFKTPVKTPAIESVNSPVLIDDSQSQSILPQLAAYETVESEAAWPTAEGLEVKCRNQDGEFGQMRFIPDTLITALQEMRDSDESDASETRRSSRRVKKPQKYMCE